MEDFAVLAGGDFQAVGDLGGHGEDGELLVLPAEEVTGEEGEVGDDRAACLGNGGDGIEKAFLGGGVGTGIELDLAVHQRER